MDQQSNTTPSVRLPQPSFDPMAAHAAMPQQHLPMQPAVPQAQVAPQQLQPQAPQQPMQQPTPVAATTEGASADSQDEEWIAKAKNIAAQYKNDPFAESTALSQLRAEYLYKQHGITTKLGEK